MKLNEIQNFLEFYEETKTQNYPLQFSYTLTKIKNEVEVDISYYKDTINSILQKYAQTENGEFKYNEDKTYILIKPECMEQCNEEISELNNLDFSNCKTKIKLSIIPQGAISPEKLNKIFPFIEE